MKYYLISYSYQYGGFFQESKIYRADDINDAMNQLKRELISSKISELHIDYVFFEKLPEDQAQKSATQPETIVK